MHCKPISCNDYKDFPVMNEGSLQWEQGLPVMKTGVPCNENRVFPLRIYYTGKPCSGPVLTLYEMAVWEALPHEYQKYSTKLRKLCQEMATLPAEYIPQCKLPSASSIGSLGFIVCVQCCRMVDSVPIRHTYYLYPVANTVRPSSSIGTWPNSLDGRPPWYCIVSHLLQTKHTSF